MSEQTQPQHSHQYVYFVDGKEYKSNTETLTGSAIKDAAKIPANYQLMLEGHGNEADIPIADSQVVDLKGGSKHFYGAPPATYGGC